MSHSGEHRRSQSRTFCDWWRSGKLFLNLSVTSTGGDTIRSHRSISREQICFANENFVPHRSAGTLTCPQFRSDIWISQHVLGCFGFKRKHEIGERQVHKAIVNGTQFQFNITETIIAAFHNLGDVTAVFSGREIDA